MLTSKWNRQTVPIPRFRCTTSAANVEETQNATIRLQATTPHPTVEMGFDRISILVHFSMTPTRVDRTTVRAHSSSNRRMRMMRKTKRRLLERDSASSVVTWRLAFTMASLPVRHAKHSSSAQFKVGKAEAKKRNLPTTLHGHAFLGLVYKLPKFCPPCVDLCCLGQVFCLGVRCSRWLLT